ncbi:hypothetical protein EFB14_26805 [Rhizobium fabae]|uniref:Uncharacterized protein n=1 Tax=Rhizobium fabae TaxID=573179 RepID=A0ABY0B2Q5_9HYPH|nr:hypothetical protein EFB14_26805 [Rhizobium fabae]
MFVRKRTDTAKSGLAAGGLAGYGPPRRSCFPGAVQTWPRFGGAFFLSGAGRIGNIPSQCEI